MPDPRPSALLTIWISLGMAIAGLHPLDAPAADVQPTVELVFVGDINLDDLPGKVVSRGGDPFADFAPVFEAADYVVGNLECVIATTGKPFPKKYTFRAHPRCLAPLAKHFDAVSVANNHTGDYGKEAFTEQLDLLKANKIGLFGGGRNLREARQPLLVEQHGVRIALLGYNEFKPRDFAATETAPGLAWSVDEHVLADIKSAKDLHRADVVIPFLHWGWEYEPEPNERQRTFARKMIDAGADAVVGAHPHVTETAEYYKGHLIVYSLGNFVFSGFKEPEARVGWVLRLAIDKSGISRWDTLVARIDEDGIPHRAPQDESPAGERGSPQPHMQKSR